jgi:hypothetical protein
MEKKKSGAERNSCSTILKLDEWTKEKQVKIGRGMFFERIYPSLEKWRRVRLVGQN